MLSSLIESVDYEPSNQAKQFPSHSGYPFENQRPILSNTRKLGIEDIPFHTKPNQVCSFLALFSLFIYLKVTSLVVSEFFFFFSCK